MRPPHSYRSCYPAAFLLAVAARVGLSTAAYNTSNATGLSNSQILNDPFPYYFPQENASPAQLFAMPACNGVKIEEATIDELQNYMSSGNITSVELVTCYIQRAFQTGEYIK